MMVYGIKDKAHEVITEMTSIYGRTLAHKRWETLYQHPNLKYQFNLRKLSSFM